MAKSFLYKYFGVGKLPEPVRKQLAAEGIVAFDEGIKGSITYRNFHRPGMYSNYRKVAMVASLALTDSRIAAYRAGRPIIDVPLTDPRLAQMDFSVDGDMLIVKFAADLFQTDWSGEIEYHFRTDFAGAIVTRLKR